MNLTISHTGDVALVHVGEARLMYPLLSDFAGSVAGIRGNFSGASSPCAFAAQIRMPTKTQHIRRAAGVSPLVG